MCCLPWWIKMSKYCMPCRLDTVTVPSCNQFNFYTLINPSPKTFYHLWIPSKTIFSIYVIQYQCFFQLCTRSHQTLDILDALTVNRLITREKTCHQAECNSCFFIFGSDLALAEINIYFWNANCVWEISGIPICSDKNLGRCW